ncbi:MAG: hypothetical protein V1777_05120 [Candidatus Micrarchaeota archaeon]
MVCRNLFVLVKKDGIVFALVNRRFETFKQLTSACALYLKNAAGKPLVIIFPDLPLGNKAVSRRQTKDWLSKLGPQLSGHSNAYVFFSMLEKSPLKNTVSHTGYLVRPPAKSGKNRAVFWQAVPKVTLAESDYEDMPHQQWIRSRPNPRFKKDLAHWMRRANRFSTGKRNGEPLFRFPRVKINGRTVELRICGDLAAASRTPADIVAVPAWNLASPTEYRKDVLKFAGRHGFTVINDLKPSDAKPQVTLVKKNRIRQRNRWPEYQIHPKRGLMRIPPTPSRRRK